MDLDDFYLKVNEFGSYQILCIFLLTVGSCFLDGYNCFANVFLLYTPTNRCRLHPSDAGDFGSNSTILAAFTNGTFGIIDASAEDGCSLAVKPVNQTTTFEATPIDLSNYTIESVDGHCPFGLVYSKQYFDSTVITQWDLVCDQKYHSKLLLMCIGISAITGTLLLSWFQDRFGRRACFIVCNAWYTLTGISCVFSPNFLVFSILRILNAFPMHAGWNTCYTWALEYVGMSKRTPISTIHCIIFSLASISVGVVSYFCRTWVQVGLATSVPFLFAFLICLVVCESPRWLLMHHKKAAAEKVLRRIAASSRQVKDEVEVNRLIKEVVESCEAKAKVDEVEESIIAKICRIQMLDLFRGPALRTKTMIVMFCFISNCVVYAAIAFNSENISGDFYIAYCVQAAMEAPATLVNLFTLNRFGRIWPIFLAMAFSGVVGIVCAGGSYYPSALLIVLASLSKFGISMSFDGIYQLAAELFPTVVRGQGIGLVNTVGEAGNVVMPFILVASVVFKQLPMVIMGILTLTGAIALLFLPETKGRYMPETLHDGETYGKTGCAAFRENLKELRGCCSREKRKRNKTHPADSTVAVPMQ